MSIKEQVSWFLKKNGRNPICQRGEDIYLASDIELVVLDTAANQAEYHVDNLEGTNRYHVELFGIGEPEGISSHCDCPYDHTPICKHAFAALMELADDLRYLTDLYGTDFYDHGAIYLYDEVKGFQKKAATTSRIARRSAPTTARQLLPNFESPIHIQDLKSYSNILIQDNWHIQSWIYYTDQINIIGNQVTGTVRTNRKNYRPTVSLSEDHQLSCSCTCGAASDTLLCKHGYTLLAKLADDAGSHRDALFFIRDHSEQIGEKLTAYGMSLQDNWQDQFEVEISYPEIEITPKDPGLSKIAAFANWKEEIVSFVKPDLEIRAEHFHSIKPNYGILWNFSPSKLPGVFLDLLTGKRKKNGDLGAPLRVIQPREDIGALNKAQVEVLDILRRVDVMNDDHYGMSRFSEVDLEDLQRHHRKILEVYPLLLQEEHYFCEEAVHRDTISAGKTKRIFPQSTLPRLSFEFRKSKTHYLLKPLIHLEEESYSLTDFETISYGVLRQKDRLYFLDQASARTAMFFGEKAAYRIRQEDLEAFTEEFLIPLMDRFEVKILGTALDVETIEGTAHKKLYLKEVETYLVLLPAIRYIFENGLEREVYLDRGKQLVFKDEGTNKVFIFKRDEALEHEIRAFIEGLHPRFEQEADHYFSLPVGQVMEGGWFF